MEININSAEELFNLLTTNKSLQGVNIHAVNLMQLPVNWDEIDVQGGVFLGCTFEKSIAVKLISRGAVVYPKFRKLPYDPYRTKLYTHQELLEGYSATEDRSLDLKIYNHFLKYKYNPPLQEAMAQRLHDHSIDHHLRELLGYDRQGMTRKKAVGFMGGHSERRSSDFYKRIAQTAMILSEKGYYVVSGGGPGIMEAANLGAYMAGKSFEDLDRAIGILQDLNFQQPGDKDYLAKNYIEQSHQVLQLFPNGQDNLAIPTWFYGHEPSNLFASHIAKYFSNSIREDTLLAISLYGIIFGPGSAGTTQEIFQEAAQNHYGTFGYYSPMVFMGKKRYTEDTALYSVLHQLAQGQRYKDLLFITDAPELAAEFIVEHPPISTDRY